MKLNLDLNDQEAAVIIILAVMFRVFIRSINKGLPDIDSFYFIKNQGLTGIMKLIMSSRYYDYIFCGIFVSCMVILWLLTHNKKTMILFSFSPFVYMAYNWALVERNIILMFLVFVSLYASRQKLAKNIILQSAVLIGFYYSWSLWFLWLVFIVSYAMREIVKSGIIKLNYKIMSLSVYILIIGAVLIAKRNLIMEILSLQDHIIELSPILKLYFPEIIFMAVVMIIILVEHYFDKIDYGSYEMTGLELFGMMFALFLRNYVLFVPFFYVVAGKMFNLDNKNHLSVLMPIAGIAFVCSMPIYMAPSFNTPEIHEVVKYANAVNESCIAPFWSYGHIVSYYTNKDVIFKASPPADPEPMLDYFVYGNNTECVMVFSRNDIKVMQGYTNITPDTWFIMKHNTSSYGDYIMYSAYHDKLVQAGKINSTVRIPINFTFNVQ